MPPEAREALSIRLKLTVLEYAKYFGVTEACREFNIPRSSFYRWKQAYEHEGRSGLYRKKPVAYHHPRKTAPEVVGKILELRSAYQIGALRIAFYLERYQGVKISESTVTRVSRAHGVGSLPKTAPRRALHTKRYAKTVPGHHVRLDVKFLRLKDQAGKAVKRYQ
jgi:transposase